MALSHLDDAGKARMVDVSAKPVVKRTAVARGTVRMGPETIRLIADNKIPKGDVFAAARIAGIAGGKRASDLIPLCHPLPIDAIAVDFSVSDASVEITARAVCTAKTGIEMEALTAVSIAALTIYDMCKAVDPSITITDIVLVEKTKEALA